MQDESDKSCELAGHCKDIKSYFKWGGKPLKRWEGFGAEGVTLTDLYFKWVTLFYMLTVRGQLTKKNQWDKLEDDYNDLVKKDLGQNNTGWSGKKELFNTVFRKRKQAILIGWI